MPKTYGKRICPFCNKGFEATHPRQRVCKDDHFAPCPRCGKPVKIIDTSYASFLKSGPKLCKECSIAVVSEKRKNRPAEEKQKTLEKRKQTNLQRYGTEFASQNPDIHQKAVDTFRKNYGVDWVFASKDIQEKSRLTLNKTHGVDRPMQSSEIASNVSEKLKANADVLKVQREETCIERYGVPNAMQNPEITERCFASIEAKYGTRGAISIPEIQNKIREHNLAKYGVEWITQSENVKDTIRKNNMSVYGVEYPQQLPQFKEQFKQTIQERYGVDAPMQSAEIREKSRQTCLTKYGVPVVPKSSNYKMQRVSNPNQLKQWEQFLDSPRAYIQSYYSEPVSVFELCQQLGVTDTPIYEVIQRENLSDIVKHRASKIECEVASYLNQVKSDLNVIHNSRNIINPLELDLYLPDYQIAIECNPTATHNSSILDPWGGLPKEPSYHVHKTKECEKNEVFLFHIFGYEWTHRQDQIKSMLRNLVNCSERKIYARNTCVVELPAKQCADFLNANHRQGSLDCKIRLGLVENSSDELVAVMTFNKPRPGMGQKSDDNTSIYELSRFCSLCNTRVVGGASKLFSYFCKIYKPAKVISFSDRAHTRGSLYDTLGFTRVRESDPGYVWVNYKTDEYLHRTRCQKANLPKLFNEPSLDIEHQTEKEIMRSHGYVQVFDCGVVRWEWSP